MKKPAHTMKLAYPDWLLQKTFAVQYNPNCPSPFLVRLVRPGTGRIDGKAAFYVGTHRDTEQAPHVTNDCLGYGLTLQEAAEEALKCQQKAEKIKRIVGG